MNSKGKSLKTGIICGTIILCFCIALTAFYVYKYMPTSWQKLTTNTKQQTVYPVKYSMADLPIGFIIKYNTDDGIKALWDTATADETIFDALYNGLIALPYNPFDENSIAIADYEGNEWLRKTTPTGRLIATATILANYKSAEEYELVDVGVEELLEAVYQTYGVLSSDGKFAGRFRFYNGTFRPISGYAIRTDLLSATPAS